MNDGLLYLKFLLFDSLDFLTVIYDIYSDGNTWEKLENMYSKAQVCLQCFPASRSVAHQWWKLSVQDLQLPKVLIWIRKVSLLLQQSRAFFQFSFVLECFGHIFCNVVAIHWRWDYAKAMASFSCSSLTQIKALAACTWWITWVFCIDVTGQSEQ